jgi:hypothetical protein
MRRLEMPRTREILRLKYEALLSLREIAQACNCGKSTVSNDKQLMSLLYPPTERKASFPEPDSA